MSDCKAYKTISFKTKSPWIMLLLWNPRIVSIQKISFYFRACSPLNPIILKKCKGYDTSNNPDLPFTCYKMKWKKQKKKTEVEFSQGTTRQKHTAMKSYLQKNSTSETQAAPFSSFIPLQIFCKKIISQTISEPVLTTEVENCKNIIQALRCRWVHFRIWSGLNITLLDDWYITT